MLKNRLINYLIINKPKDLLLFLRGRTFTGIDPIRSQIVYRSKKIKIMQKLQSNCFGLGIPGLLPRILVTPKRTRSGINFLYPGQFSSPLSHGIPGIPPEVSDSRIPDGFYRKHSRPGILLFV